MPHKDESPRRPGSSRKRPSPRHKVTVRIDPHLVEQIDLWRARQEDNPSRAEAVRRLLEVGLAGGRPAMREKGYSANRTKIARMAGRQLDLMADKEASNEERAARKKTLLKGPKEFHALRKELTKRDRSGSG